MNKTESKTTEIAKNHIHFVPDEELTRLYKNVRNALELKFKILDILRVKMVSYKELQNPSYDYDMRDHHALNEEKLQKIKKVLEDFNP